MLLRLRLLTDFTHLLLLLEAFRGRCPLLAEILYSSFIEQQFLLRLRLDFDFDKIKLFLLVFDFRLLL